MGFRYATTAEIDDGTVTLIDLNPAMGTDDRKWTEHDLDGVRFRLRCRWIEKASLWLLDLLDRQGEPLLVGMVIRVGQMLTFPHIGETLPGRGYGVIIARDTSSQGQDPGDEDLGRRVKLTYVPAVEV
jgi:hypothetical protein